MVTTKVTNNYKVCLQIKEGIAGMYSIVGDVDPGKSFLLIVSEHATYSEYWFSVHPNDTRESVILTSDDCVEWEEVKIHMNETNKLAWKGIKKRTSVRLPSDEKLHGYLGRVVDFVKKVHS